MRQRQIRWKRSHHQGYGRGTETTRQCIRFGMKFYERCACKVTRLKDRDRLASICELNDHVLLRYSCVRVRDVESRRSLKRAPLQMNQIHGLTSLSPSTLKASKVTHTVSSPRRTSSVLNT